MNKYNVYKNTFPVVAIEIMWTFLKKKKIKGLMLYIAQLCAGNLQITMNSVLCRIRGTINVKAFLMDRRHTFLTPVTMTQVNYIYIYVRLFFLCLAVFLPEVALAYYSILLKMFENKGL